MIQKRFMLVCTIGIVLLAGCSGVPMSEYNINKTVNDSEAVQSIHTENISENESQINIDLKDEVKQNDQYTSIIIVGGVPQTRYFDDWKQVQITNVSVVNENGTTVHTQTGSNLNGSSIKLSTDNSGSYEYRFKSLSGGVSEFGLELDNGTIVDGYSDDKI